MFSWLHFLRSFDLPELIFCLPVCYKLLVLMPSSLFYLPSMTSIRCLLNICHSLSVKYLPKVILPIRSDQTVECTHPGADFESVSLVATIFRHLHKVTVKGSLTVPGTDISQTYSGSLEVNPQLLRGILHESESSLRR
jgi:hypothetical protein